jgi:hypothetical protein
MGPEEPGPHIAQPSSWNQNLTIAASGLNMDRQSADVGNEIYLQP